MNMKQQCQALKDKINSGNAQNINQNFNYNQMNNMNIGNQNNMNFVNNPNNFQQNNQQMLNNNNGINNQMQQQFNQNNNMNFNNNQMNQQNNFQNQMMNQNNINMQNQMMNQNNVNMQNNIVNQIVIIQPGFLNNYNQYINEIQNFLSSYNIQSDDAPDTLSKLLKQNYKGEWFVSILKKGDICEFSIGGVKMENFLIFQSAQNYIYIFKYI